jgi:hypothetical protein
MKAKLGCAAAVIYLVIGVIQMLATIRGIQLWTDLPWLISAIISMFIAYLPLVGTVAGIKGATDVWGWGFWSAVAFFCWPYVIYVLAIVVGGVADLMSRRRGK